MELAFGVGVAIVLYLLFEMLELNPLNDKLGNNVESKYCLSPA